VLQDGSIAYDNVASTPDVSRGRGSTTRPKKNDKRRKRGKLKKKNKNPKTGGGRKPPPRLGKNPRFRSRRRSRARVRNESNGRRLGIFFYLGPPHDGLGTTEVPKSKPPKPTPRGMVGSREREKERDLPPPPLLEPIDPPLGQHGGPTSTAVVCHPPNRCWPSPHQQDQRLRLWKGGKKKKKKKGFKKKKRKPFFPPLFFSPDPTTDGFVMGTATVGCDRFPLGDFKHF
jgi:hypothetical protein